MYAYQFRASPARTADAIRRAANMRTLSRVAVKWERLNWAEAREFEAMRISGGVPAEGFSQDGDLPGVVQVVLQHAVQEDVSRFAGSRGFLFQLGVVQVLGGLAQTG